MKLKVCKYSSYSINCHSVIFRTTLHSQLPWQRWAAGSRPSIHHSARARSTLTSFLLSMKLKSAPRVTGRRWTEIALYCAAQVVSGVSPPSGTNSRRFQRRAALPGRKSWSPVIRRVREAEKSHDVCFFALGNDMWLSYGNWYRSQCYDNVRWTRQNKWGIFLRSFSLLNEPNVQIRSEDLAT